MDYRLTVYYLNGKTSQFYYPTLNSAYDAYHRLKNSGNVLGLRLHQAAWNPLFSTNLALGLQDQDLQTEPLGGEGGP